MTFYRNIREIIVSASNLYYINSGSKTSYESYFKTYREDRVYCLVLSPTPSPILRCYVGLSQMVAYENIDSYFKAINPPKDLVKIITTGLARDQEYSNGINQPLYVYQVTVFDEKLVDSLNDKLPERLLREYDSSGKKELEKKLVKKFLSDGAKTLTYLAKGLGLDFESINFIKSCWFREIIKELNSYENCIYSLLKPKGRELVWVLAVGHDFATGQDCLFKEIIDVEVSEEQVREFMALGKN